MTGQGMEFSENLKATRIVRGGLGVPAENRKFHAQFPLGEAVSFWLPVPRA
jgi:hypothetical protein